MIYPPLARQTRIAGMVVLQVSVAADGTVGHVEVLKGHPLLSAAVVQSVREWMFSAQPGESRTFELKCEFVLSETSSSIRRDVRMVAEPLHLLLLASPPQIETQTTK
jgi:TonB family protein